MSDERDWFDAMVAASKEAAGLPSDWGTAPSPLSPEENHLSIPIHAGERLDRAGASGEAEAAA